MITTASDAAGVEPAVIDVALRWGDMDAQGHVNNGAIIDYLQEARIDFLREGGQAGMVGSGIVVVQHQVVYRRPVVYSSSPLRVTVAPVEVGAARVRMAYDLHHDGELCAQATTTVCPYDFDAERPRRLGEQERAWFASRIAHVGPELGPLRTPALQGRGTPMDLRVRWSDVDSYGHVNNVRFFDYVQEARIVTTNVLDPSTQRLDGTASGDRSLWLVARQDVDYVGQMHHRAEPYRVLTAPSHLGTTSMVLAAEIVDPEDADRVLARGRTVLVQADAAGRPVPLDDATRARLTAALVD